MPWRRKAPTEPEVEWAAPVHELEQTPPADSSLAPPPPPPAAVRRIPRLDPQRTLLTICAVVATLALVATAMVQRDLRDATRRQNCLVEAQYLSFAESGAFGEGDSFREALGDCGIDVPDPNDEGG